MSDQMQTTLPAVSVLSALLEHPEFLHGLAFAQEVFLGEFEAAPLTEEEMIEEVEMNLSRRITEQCERTCRALGDEALSYLSNLGYVVGTIAQGLTYAQ